VVVLSSRESGIVPVEDDASAFSTTDWTCSGFKLADVMLRCCLDVQDGNCCSHNDLDSPNQGVPTTSTQFKYTCDLVSLISQPRRTIPFAPSSMATTAISEVIAPRCVASTEESLAMV
jgi:hypothetical protein